MADANAPLKPTQDALAALSSAAALGHDQAAEKPETDAAKPQAPGRTAQAFGVSFMPATVVIDRNGIVRAAGIRLDKAKDIIEKLLSEEAR
jgi:hypothetical protein